MEISAREAARRIGERHLLCRDQARRVLAAGLAGRARRTPRALLYDEEAVEQLLDRPPCSRSLLDTFSPLIVRIGRSRTFRVDDPWETQAETVAGEWYVPILVRMWLSKRGPLGLDRFVFLATLGGWVVFGAEAAGFDYTRPLPVPRPRSRSEPPLRWKLEPPDGWFQYFENTWLPIENGPAWTAWGAPTMTPSPLDSLRADYFEQVAAYERWKAESALPVLRAEAAGQILDAEDIDDDDID